MKWTQASVLGLSILGLLGCEPDLGPCDVDAARSVVYRDDGAPMYAGQALLQRSCGDAAFCHMEGISTHSRLGAPEHLNFDLSLATTADQVERLRRNQATTMEWRLLLWQTIENGSMPPGDVGVSVVESSRTFAGLPELTDTAGQDMLRNWLSCGVPVVERTDNNRPSGITPVGAIVPPIVNTGCAPSEIPCGGRCTDITQSALHCGGCGVACGVGQSCVDGACSAMCSAGLDACDNGCANLSSDAQNCGSCGNLCSAAEVCAAGTCSSEGCPEGTANCGGSCVNPQTSVFHCGSCGRPCGSGESCNAGTCDCGDTTSDPFNCGACGNVCPSGQECAGGNCNCSGGLSLCSGACVDTNVDTANCGGCGVVCGGGQACSDGSCVACGEGISFAADILPILTATCGGTMCHDGRRPAENLRIDGATAYSELVGPVSSCNGIPHVTPGDPDNSYLINKLTGQGMCRGSVMPKADARLSPAEIALFRNWICGGALNN